MQSLRLFRALETARCSLWYHITTALFVLSVSIPVAQAQTQTTAPASNSSEASSGTPGSVADDKAVVRLDKFTVNGSADQDYRVHDITNIGPFASTDLQHTPYSLNVISSALIESMQASTVDQLWRVNPFVENPIPQTRTGSGLGYVRGFYTTQQREDGLYSAFAVIDLEDKESVQLLSGQSGFLYGVNPPGGLINYVLKRPTKDISTSLSTGSYGGGSYFAHADFSGPLDQSGMFGYRINVLAQDGETAIEHQNITRDLVSGAVDWHVTSDALVQIDASHSYYRVDGSPAIWQLSSTTAIPAAPEASKLWGQKYDFDRYRTDKIGARGSLKLNDVFTVRGAASWMAYEREDIYTNNVIDSTAQTYSIIALPFAPRNIDSAASQLFLDSHFSTGEAEHLLTVGYDGDILNEHRHEDQSAVLTIGTGIIGGAPTYISLPVYSIGMKPKVLISHMVNRNLILSDSVRLSPQWTVLGGMTNAKLSQENYAVATGIQSADYEKSRWTPSASVIYSPATFVSAYVTYIEGLQQGGTAPTTAVNSGEIMPPMKTNEIELGAKATLGRTALTLAFFDMEKAFEYTDPQDNVYRQAGREEHKGIELGVTGKVIPLLSIYGGLTYLDPKVTRNAANPALQGKQPISVAKEMAKLYAELDIPFVPGLAVTGGIYYTGRSPVDIYNLSYLGGYTTEDLGLRYQFNACRRPVVARINVSNVTDKTYWMSSFNGTNLYTGDPRSVAFSLQTKF